MANIKMTYTLGANPIHSNATETIEVTSPKFALEVLEGIKQVRKFGIPAELKELIIDGQPGAYASEDHGKRIRSAEARLKKIFDVDRTEVGDPVAALTARLRG